MTRTAVEIGEMMERFKTTARGAGVKLTPQRAAIFREVAKTDAHPNIETIFRGVRRSMPSVSLDTVYRTLALLTGLGLVATVRPLGHHVRFDANTRPHHHFICSHCGAAIDFEDRDFDNLRIPASASALGRVVSRHVELRGLCAPCAAGAARTGRSPRTIGTESHRKYTTSTRRD
jgi:Fur family peroxide stress response transcriptional regulator